jgi:hypothetical protein
MAWCVWLLSGESRVNDGRPRLRTRVAASPAASLLSSDATVTLKLAPVGTVGVSAFSDQAKIDAIAGRGTRK